MCSINHDLKCVFVHTPKCGGLYVQKVLEVFYGFHTFYFTHENHADFVDEGDDPPNQHGFLRIRKQGVLRYFMSSDVHNQKTGMTPEKWATYTKMAVRRNPYDRFVSAFHYVNSRRATNPLMLDNVQHRVTPWEYFHLYISQYEQLLDTSGTLNIDMWLNFENLTADLCRALLSLGVTKIKHRELLLNNVKLNSTPHDSYCKYYSPKLIDFVNTTFANDFVHLKYEPVQTLEELKEQSTLYNIPQEMFNKRNIQLVIELDKTNSIIQFDDAYYETASKKNKPCVLKQQETETALDRIVLPNGLVLNTQQTPKQETPAPPDHFGNLMTLVRKMAETSQTHA